MSPDRLAEYRRFGYVSDLTMAASVVRAARQWGSRPAIIEGGQQLTYQELLEIVERAAAWLAGAGVGPGDVVCWQTPNWWEAHVLGLAVWHVGAVSCPIAPFYREHELRQVIEQVRPAAVVTAETFRGFAHAEAFDDFSRSGGTVRRTEQGWRIKDVVSRADTWFLVSAVRATSTWLSKLERAEARADAGPSAPSGEGGTARPGTEVTSDATVPGVAFDRGLFTAAVAGHTVRWAFMPPYLNTLTFSERDLAARRGWALTRQALGEMQDVSRGIGATFVVVFLPFKSQVYLPWLAQSQPADELSRALRFYLSDNPGAPDVTQMLANRLAQNRLMRRFCTERGIPLIDTTDALTQRFTAGENVYFPDESHLNERGHAVVADTVAAYLASEHR